MMLLLFAAIGDVATKSSANTYKPQLLIVAIVLAGWYIFSTSVNDISDEEIDKINLAGNKERPLANHQVSRAYLGRLATVAAALATVAALFISPVAAIMTAAALLLSYIYSFPPIRLAKRGILAPLSLPIGYILFPLLLTVQVNKGALNGNYLLLGAALYVSFIGRIILKDFRDVKGDSQFGKRTFIVRHGGPATCLVSALAWLVGDGLIILRFKHNLLFLGLCQVYVVTIFYFLSRLAQEHALKRQILYVGLVGRLGNGVALLLLALLYGQLQPQKAPTYNLLLIGLAAFNGYAAYSLYKPALAARTTKAI